jgi:hypothetical protein
MLIGTTADEFTLFVALTYLRDHHVRNHFAII